MFIPLFFLWSSIVGAQDIKSDSDFVSFINPKTTHRHDRRKNHRTQMELWRMRPIHIYLGFYIMESIRLQPMKFTNQNSYISQHDRRYDGTFDGNLAIRVYLGLMIKSKNCIEISIENFPHDIIFDYKPDPKQYGPFTFGSLSSWGFYSASYKRDIFPKSKVCKLYLGGLFGIAYVGNTGFLDTFSTNSFGVQYSHVKFYKQTIAPIIGPTLNTDVNFGKFTFGLKFRLYWNPWTVWGKDVTIKYLNSPQEKFRVESAVLNFNWGAGLRYTF